MLMLQMRPVTIANTMGNGPSDQSSVSATAHRCETGTSSLLLLLAGIELAVTTTVLALIVWLNLGFARMHIVGAMSEFTRKGIVNEDALRASLDSAEQNGGSVDVLGVIAGDMIERADRLVIAMLIVVVLNAALVSAIGWMQIRRRRMHFHAAGETSSSN